MKIDAALTIGLLAVLIFFVWAFFTFTARAADMDLPPEITQGYSISGRAAMERYYIHRWAQLCKGGGRYQAMSEAYELGRPSPCK